MIRCRTGLFLGIVLTGCGPIYDGDPAGQVVEQLRDRFVGSEPVASAAPPVTRELVAANPGSYLLVTAADGETTAAMTLIAGQGTRRTFMSADQISVTVDRGVIVATRGFPTDRMASELRGVLEAIAVGGGTAERVHETLDGLDQIKTELLQCRIALAGAENVEILGEIKAAAKVTEDCSGSNSSFSNVYWISPDAGIVKSRQWVAPLTEMLTLASP